MILLLDTSTPVCSLSLIDGDWRYDDEWQADRTLAKGLLAYLRDQLAKNGKTFGDVTALGAFRGPGSFTGLRIGLTVLNTMADAQNIPIVGGMGDDWQAEVRAKLARGENEKIVLPFYGSDAHITKPRK
ncbi:tRNA (adenosine(37)-N6)-threonylcarbamoyltransferase complex dimerization subunit type 1 TsaB [Streptomyces caniscabiei]|uniref:tRNA (adenosine(37)-N6)-threonylcarbamoyltransferase complex dimerization subunit type 1 TsaB n=1 Tax=Streptomyces caniscabiei TaxID=2746961 RepID=UPI0029AD3FC2|nr:tRNA (adenosine(37)-N6)-threonylcarbamoyltransferase complex dimerization subunit type 1 TsaB [Streptomyces caniscabiei]MDX2776573.1 tRNA (adenosine(37)-N6)-threonylcarbamoyltransferase complex dimerization subunit type 1 TsaB [Streptomyces caniscabiei]